MNLQQGSPRDAGMNAKRLQKVIDLTHSWVDKGETPMAVTLVARKGIVVLEDAYGRLTPHADSPKVDMDSIYPIASISKVITAAIAMTLVEEGRFSIIRPVQEYIPEFTGEGKEYVEIHHLMTHTAGIKDQHIWEQAKDKEKSLVIPELDATQHPDVYRRLALGYDVPLWKRPGEEMSYSSYSIDLLAEIIRRTTGQSLEQSARERVFNPIGMKDSYFVVPERVHERVAKFPENSWSGDWFSRPEALAKPSASGGAYSTARDLAAFGQMFLNKGRYNGDTVLSKATVETMTRNHIPGVQSVYSGRVFKEAGWGLGWMLCGNKKDESGSLRSQESYYHTGAGCSILLVDPVNETVVVNFTVSMVTLPNGEPLRRFDFINDIVMGSIE